MKELQTIKAEHSFHGTIRIPGDKSMSHRAIMLSAISDSEILIEGLLESEDVFATIEAFRAMGVEIGIDEYSKFWKVQGVGLHGLKKPTQDLNMGNSGTSARLIMGILAGQDFETTITGDNSLCKRPMERITEPLSQMGAEFVFSKEKGCLPIRIIGNPNLKPLKNYEMPVASAQIKSAILLAGLYADGETSIIEKEASRDHTENMLRDFGVNIEKVNSTIKLHPDKLHYSKEDMMTVPRDPSSAAFFITAGLLVERADINFHFMSLNETRTGFLDVVQDILNCKGIRINKYPKTSEPYASDILIHYTDKIENKEYVIPPEYAPRMIDEYPILAVLAAGSEAVMHMEGIGELRVKESDRIAVMQEGLEACGVDVKSGKDWMTVYGTGKVRGGVKTGSNIQDFKIKTHLDHRIAMSFIILGLIAENPIIIDDVSPIMTSFPNFFDELKMLNINYDI